MNTLRAKRSTETRTLVIALASALDPDEELSGTPTFVEVGSSALTFADAQIQDAEITVDGYTQRENSVITCLVSGGVAGNNYDVRATVGTDNGQTISAFTFFLVN